MNRGLGLGLLVALAGPVGAQPVTVKATDAATQRPLIGALVSVRDSAGKVLGRALTNERGTVSVNVPTPFRIRVDAIGFAGQESALVASAASQPVVTFSLIAAPLSLPELRVAGGTPICQIDSDEGLTVARLWDEARKALTATTLTSSNRSLAFELELVERDLDAKGRVLNESRDIRRGNARRPFRAQDPALLSRDGYIQRRVDGDWYYGPDAELLLSESFLGDHCYGLASVTPERPGLVGLAFAPAEQRQLPDIRGVLWIDRQSAELSHVDFSFDRVELPDEARGIGGRVGFKRLPTGGWFIDTWLLRMPKYAVIRDPMRTRLRLDGYRETVGRAGPVGSLPTDSRTRVVGTVFDSLAGGPVAGAVISLQAGAFADTTDDQGEFEITSPGIGHYLVTASHPRLAILGLGDLTADAALTRGKADTVAFAVPGQGTLLERFCGPKPEGRAIVGRAESAAGAEFWVYSPSQFALTRRLNVRPGMRYRVGVYERGVRWSVPLDSAGRFLVCGLPLEGPLTAGVGAKTLFEATEASPRLIVLEPSPPK